MAEESDNYEIVENSSDGDYPPAMPINESIREALSRLDEQRSMLKQEESGDADFGFDDSTLGYGTYDGRDVEIYGEKEDREDTIIKNLEEDLNYSAYFYERYGSVEFYFTLEDIYQKTGFDTASDKKVTVKIIKDGKLYISDFVNPNQILEELIDGVVSFLVFKVNGQIARITGTLKEELVNGDEHVRNAAFSLLPDGRVLLWNVMKQKWSSFYPDNLLEMTRDDTSAFE